MKKSRIVAPVPVKVVLQYRLIALAVLGVLALGVIYVPSVSENVVFAPPASDLCSTANCHDACLDNDDVVRCSCEKNSACSCKIETNPCDAWQGERCALDPANGNVACVKDKPGFPPTRSLVCCNCGDKETSDFGWWVGTCPAGCSLEGNPSYPGGCGPLRPLPNS